MFFYCLYGFVATHFYIMDLVIVNTVRNGVCGLMHILDGHYPESD